MKFVPIHESVSCERLGADALGSTLASRGCPYSQISPRKGTLPMSEEAGEVPRFEHAALDVAGCLRTSMDGSPGRIPIPS